jgi:thiol:disulfide interchange protein DsbD
MRVPLKLLSGFPPPDFYTIAETDSDCPLGLDCVKDFEQGLELARAANRPMLLDFTGWACVNCRKMEEQVWSRPEVFEVLKQEFILVSLYVDDRQELSEEQQFVFTYQNGKSKRVRTVGDLWSTFQTFNFGSISQPFYVQLSPQLEVLNRPLQNSDAETYLNWLKQGLKKRNDYETTF